MGSRTEAGSSSSATTRLEISQEGNMAVFMDELVYETVTLKDCQFSEEENTFYYLCPCGDLFDFRLEELLRGNLVAECPSCSLRARLDLKPGELEPYMRKELCASTGSE